MTRFMLSLLTGIMFLSLAGLASAATVTLLWNANTELDLAGYNLYRAPKTTTVCGTFAKVGSVGKVTTMTNTVTVAGTYCYELTAFNQAGESPRSNKVEVIVTITNPPMAPRNLRATVMP